MASHSLTFKKMKRISKKAADKAAYRPFVESMARIGYGARGIVYLFMGLLSIKVALGAGGQAADQQGAIAAVGSRHSGWMFLIALLLGLVCYSLWGLVRAVFDPLRLGRDARAVAERIGFLCSAVSYALLVSPTLQRISGGPRPVHNGGQTEQTQHSVAQVMAMPLGPWMTGLAGVIVIAVGLIQIYQGIKLEFDRRTEARALRPRYARWVKQVGRVGIIARGMLFMTVGVLLLMAGYHINPGEAQGFDGALRLLLRQPFGLWLMGIVAAGLIAMGLYSLMIALWFRLKRL